MTKPDTLAMCLILASVLLGSVGQIVLKSGMEHAPQVTSGWALASAFRSPVVLAGLACYVMATLAWLVVLQRVPVSFAYPMISLNYIFVTLLAKYVHGEAVPSLRYLGLALILAGVAVIARTPAPDPK
ncbi:MAG TPA: EamA family transporter [Armatimonadetes bacterium]|nr:EamA family transporter [Armatimonadota bacterium]